MGRAPRRSNRPPERGHRSPGPAAAPTTPHPPTAARRPMPTALVISILGQALERQTAIGGQRAASPIPTPRPTSQACAGSHGPCFSSVSSTWMRCAVPAVGHPCVWSRPSRTPRWPARSSNASICPPERHRSGPRRTSSVGTKASLGTRSLPGRSISRRPTATSRHSPDAHRNARQHARHPPRSRPLGPSLRPRTLRSPRSPPRSQPQLAASTADPLKSPRCGA